MSKQTQAVRVVKTRDTATSILRKLGVKPRDYNLFIQHTIEGVFEVRALDAQAHLQALVQPANPAPQVEAKPNGVDKPKRAQSCSSVARDLILAGKTNDEVWVVIAEQFKLDQKKRGYPAWYRFQLRKTGHAV